jgi:hypothetical protein
MYFAPKQYLEGSEWGEVNWGWEVKGREVKLTKHIPNSADLLAVVLGSHRHNTGINDRVHDWRRVRDLLIGGLVGAL